MGPDMDIGNSPILKTLPNGKRVLIGGTKGGDVFGVDPDNNGALVFRVNVGGAPVGANRGGRGSIVWGGAVDDQHVYYGAGGAGLVALNPANGQQAWAFTAPPAVAGGRGSALGAAPTAIPGVIFEGAADGKLYAISRCRRQTDLGIQHGPAIRYRQQGPRAWRRNQHVRALLPSVACYSWVGLRDQQRRLRRKCVIGLRRGISAA